MNVSTEVADKGSDCDIDELGTGGTAIGTILVAFKTGLDIAQGAFRFLGCAGDVASRHGVSILLGKEDGDGNLRGGKGVENREG